MYALRDILQNQWQRIYQEQPTGHANICQDIYMLNMEKQGETNMEPEEPITYHWEML